MTLVHLVIGVEVPDEIAERAPRDLSLRDYLEAWAAKVPEIYPAAVDWWAWTVVNTPEGKHMVETQRFKKED